MEITRDSIRSATITSISPAEEKGKSTLTLQKPEDQEFANKYGKKGYDVTVADSKVESLGLDIGTKVDCEETGYHLITAARYEEVRDCVSMPKNVKAYILTELVNRMESHRLGQITARERDEYISVMYTEVKLSQEKLQTTTETQGKKQ